MSTEKPSHNEDEYFARQNAELLRKQREAADASAQEAERHTHYMKCPKDGHDLATADYHGVQIDRCPHCGGVWLDPGELEAIARHTDGEGLLGRIVGDLMTTLRGNRTGT